MAPNKPPPDDLLTRAAELRAAGANWTLVAAQVRRSAETVRKWPLVYAERWAAALHDAERRLAAEAGGEAVLILRTLLRSADEKVRGLAARALVAFRLDLLKVDLKAAAQNPAADATAGAAELLNTLLERHSHEHLTQIVLRHRRRSGGDGANPAGLPGGGPG